MLRYVMSLSDRDSVTECQIQLNEVDEAMHLVLVCILPMIFNTNIGFCMPLLYVDCNDTNSITHIYIERGLNESKMVYVQFVIAQVI